MQIVWTDFAITELNKVYKYYLEYAGLKVAQMITHEIISKVDQLIQHPESGTIEPKLAKLNQSHRYLLSGNIKIIYKIIEAKLVITDIFDCRQNPNKIFRSKNAK